MLIVFGVAVVGVLVEAFAAAPRALRRPARAQPRRPGRRVRRRRRRCWRARAVGRIAVMGAVADRRAGAVPAGHHPAGRRCSAVLLIAERRRSRTRRRRDGARGLDSFTPQASAVPGSVAETQADQRRRDADRGVPADACSPSAACCCSPPPNDLLTMFVALEVLSLPLYLLCGLARRRRLLSQEAALKYFLLGAFSSAFFLLRRGAAVRLRRHADPGRYRRRDRARAPATTRWR